MNVESISKFSEEELVIHLQRLHFEWNHFEIFADFLMTFSKENQLDFSKKAIAIYNYIQQESKIFSFGINSKIANAKENL